MLKQVCLKRTGWHRRLNSYVYGREYVEETDFKKWSELEKKTGEIIDVDNAPKKDKQRNMCEYFWGTVLAVIAVSFVFLVNKLFDKLDNVEPITVSNETKEKMYKIMKTTILSLMVIGFMLAGIYIGWLEVLFVAGFFAGIIGGIIGLVYFVIFIRDKYEEWRLSHPKKDKPPKERKPNAVLEYVKARKKKACPCICWED